jgi:rod shape-determining protein MreD
VILFIIRLLVTLWVVLVFRLTLGPKLAIAGVQPDLAAALVFYLTIARGPIFGILSGFVLGLLIDVDRPEGIGLSSLAWATLAFVTSRIGSALDLEDRIISSVVLGILVFMAEVIRAFVLSGIDLKEFLLLSVRWALPTAGYTAVAVPLFVLAVQTVLGSKRWLRERG